MSFIDYYKVLGVQPNSTQQEIKEAYRKLSKKFHPDLNNGDNFFAERFKEIQTAYETLIDNSRREEYNRQFDKQNEKNYSTFEKTSDSSKAQYNSTQSSNSETTATKQTQKKKRNYSWLYITLPLMVIIGLIKGTIQKSIRENAINDAVNNYQPSTTTPYISDTTTSTPNSLIIDTIKKLHNEITTDILAIDSIHSIASSNNNLPDKDNNFQEANNTTKNETEDDNNKATKKETENWLVEKLNNYTREYRNYKGNTYTGSFENFQDYKFSFNGEYLIINYVKEFFMFSSTGGSSNKTYTNVISKIPIYDLKGFSNYGFKEGYDKTVAIETNNQTIITTENGANKVSYSLPLNFRTNAETDLDDRINSALKHLKRFYSKPQSNETF